MRMIQGARPVRRVRRVWGPARGRMLLVGAPAEEEPDWGVYADSEYSAGVVALGERYREHGVRTDRGVAADQILLKSANDDQMVILVCMDARDMKVLSTETGEEYGSGYRTATEQTARRA